MLRDCFKAMDSDNDGHVSRKEFRLALEKQTIIERDIGHSSGSESRLDLRSIFSASFFDMIDKNKTEQITFKQLLRAMYPTASQDDLKQMVELVFHFGIQVCELTIPNCRHFQNQLRNLLPNLLYLHSN